MCPECPTKDPQVKSCWLNKLESGLKVIQGLNGVTTSSTLLVPTFVWSLQYYLKLMLTVRYSELSQGCCPRDPL